MVKTTIFKTLGKILLIITIFIILFYVAGLFGLQNWLIVIILLVFGLKYIIKRDWQGLKSYALFYGVLYLCLFVFRLNIIVSLLLCFTINMAVKGILTKFLRNPLGSVESLGLQLENMIYDETINTTISVMKAQKNTEQDIKEWLESSDYYFKIKRNNMKIKELTKRGVIVDFYKTKL